MFLGQPIFAEFAHVLLDFVDLAAVEVGKAPEYRVDLLLVDLVIEPEEKLDFFDLAFEVLNTDQLRAVNERLHRLLLGQTLSCKDLKVLSEVLPSLAQNVGVADDQCADRVHFEAFLLH